MAKQKAGAFWVRLDTDIWHSNDAISNIDTMPDADSILLIFFKLLTHAGKSNADGQLLLNGFIPMSTDMLAGVVRRPQEQIDRAVEVLAKFGLIRLDNDSVEIADWDDYVNVDVMAKIRADGAARTAKSREKARAAKAAEGCNVTSNVTCNDHIRIRELENGELEKERLKESSPAEPEAAPAPAAPAAPQEPKADPIPYGEIIDHLNAVCGTSFKKSADTHKRHIKARWNEGQRLEDFIHVIDVMSEEWKTPQPGKKDMRPYLRPETLFGPKMDGYRQMKRKTTGGGPEGNGGGPNGGKPGNTTGAGLGAFVIG